jgi:hypothetical protein
MFTLRKYLADNGPTHSHKDETVDLRHLDTLSARLLSVLGDLLPKFSDRWWQAHAIDQLSFQQRNHLETAGYTWLDQLDLTALLRIVDRSWFEIAHSAALPVAARTWLKEAQAIRNRWAHAPVSGIPDDERCIPGESEDRFEVLNGSVLETYYASQLELAELPDDHPSRRRRCTLHSRPRNCAIRARATSTPCLPRASSSFPINSGRYSSSKKPTGRGS